MIDIMTAEEHTPEKENNTSQNRWIAGGLISIGTILLLHNLNIFPWTIWIELLKLWPLVLILIGLKLFLKDSKNKTFIIQIALICGLLALAVITQTVSVLLVLTQANHQFFERINDLF